MKLFSNKILLLLFVFFTSYTAKQVSDWVKVYDNIYAVCETKSAEKETEEKEDVKKISDEEIQQYHLALIIPDFYLSGYLRTYILFAAHHKTSVPTPPPDSLG